MAEIRGRVVRRRGGRREPLADAAVAIVGGTRAAADIAAVTDERGEFQFADLSPGAYEVSADGVRRTVRLAGEDDLEWIELEAQLAEPGEWTPPPAPNESEMHEPVFSPEPGVLKMQR